MVIVSYKLDMEMERILPELSEYTADLYRKADDYMKMGKWMMLKADNERVFEDYKKIAFEADPDLKKEYDELGPQYEIIKKVIQARTEQNMTQKELAERIHTAQSNISRLESGSYTPSLAVLQKVATALNKDLVVSLK
jgi:DNA-binding XRE family transcriptional regulator